MKNILISGTNGMIGNMILQICLQHNEVKTITSITRKPLGIKHDKLIEVIHTKFLDYTAVESYFNNIDVCFYCIGVYTGQVSTSEFKKITVAYTEAFAKQLRKKNDNTSFCFLSGQGADSKEKSNVLFAREKGIAENIILNLQFKSTHIFRPAYIFSVEPRKEPNFLYRLMRVLYNPLKFIYPNIAVTSVQLANAMAQVGIYGSELIIYENSDIRKLK